MPESYTYICRVPSDDTDKATLTWRGTTFRNLRVVEGCRYAWEATRDGATAELCASTKGVTDLKIGGASFDCQTAR